MTDIYLQKYTTKDNKSWCGCCGEYVPSDTKMIRIQTTDGSRLIRKDHLFHWLADEKQTTLTFTYPKIELKIGTTKIVGQPDKITDDTIIEKKTSDKEVTKEPQVGLCKTCGRQKSCWFSSAEKEQCTYTMTLRGEGRQCLLEKGHSGYHSWWKQPCKVVLERGS